MAELYYASHYAGNNGPTHDFQGWVRPDGRTLRTIIERSKVISGYVRNHDIYDVELTDDNQVLLTFKGMLVDRPGLGSTSQRSAFDHHEWVDDNSIISFSVLSRNNLLGISGTRVTLDAWFCTDVDALINETYQRAEYGYVPYMTVTGIGTYEESVDFPNIYQLSSSSYYRLAPIGHSQLRTARLSDDHWLVVFLGAKDDDHNPGRTLVTAISTLIQVNPNKTISKVWEDTHSVFFTEGQYLETGNKNLSQILIDGNGRAHMWASSPKAGGNHAFLWSINLSDGSSPEILHTTDISMFDGHEIDRLWMQSQGHTLSDFDYRAMMGGNTYRVNALGEVQDARIVDNLGSLTPSFVVVDFDIDAINYWSAPNKVTTRTGFTRPDRALGYPGRAMKYGAHLSEYNSQSTGITWTVWRAKDDGVPPPLKMRQRDDGLGSMGHARINIGGTFMDDGKKSRLGPEAK